VRILICGSRSWPDVGAVHRRVSDLPKDAIVIVGGASGVDTLARAAAENRGLHVAVVNALWETWGRGAGPMRNAAMLKLQPDFVIAFHAHGSAGTANMIRQARESGVEVEVRTLDPAAEAFTAGQMTLESR
jgi:hypothetical protein